MAKKSPDSTSDEESKNKSKGVDEETQDETEDDVEDTEDEDEEETDDESDDSDDEGEEDESEDDSDEEDAEDFKKRFTQIKGDTSDEYLKNLEDTYAKSGTEASKLSKENKDLKAVVDRIQEAIAKDPKLAEALKGADVEAQKDTKPKDPVLAWAESERDRVWQKDYDKFLEAHPEIETDPELAEALNKKLAVIKRVTEEEEDRLVGMAEGLKAAWRLLGKDDTQEKVRMAAKDSASKGKTVSSSKSDKSGKVKFTDSQIEMLMNLKGVDRNKAIKLLGQYN